MAKQSFDSSVVFASQTQRESQRQESRFSTQSQHSEQYKLSLQLKRESLHNKRLSTAQKRQSVQQQAQAQQPQPQQPQPQLALEGVQSLSKGRKNTLEIIIIKCHELEAIAPDKLPSAYVIYKFFTFPDHVTPIIPEEQNPVFDDVQSFSVTMNKSLIDYVKAEELKIIVIDFSDPDSSSYLGEASIPLYHLTQHYQHKEVSEIYDAAGDQNGLIEVMLTWKEEYSEDYDDDEEPERKAKIRWKERSSIQTSESRPSVVSMGATPRPQTMKKTPQKPSLKNITRKPPPKKESNEDLDDMDDADDVDETEQNQLNEHFDYPWSRLSADLDNEFANDTGASKNIGSTITNDGTNAVENEEGGKGFSNNMDRESSSTYVAPVDNIDVTEGSDTTLFNEKATKKKDSTDQSPTASIGKSQSIEALETEANNIDDKINNNNTNTNNDDYVNTDKRSNIDDNNDTITINISHVRLNNGSPLLEDSKVRMLYVAYQFLGESPEQTETPFSLPKPSQPDVPIQFNFNKEFKVDRQENDDKRRYLSDMMNHQDPDLASIKFTLISEPQNDDDDCEDIGVAKVNLREIVRQGRDVEQQEVPIQSETDGTTLGHMGLTVKCLQTLRTLMRQKPVQI